MRMIEDILKWIGIGTCLALLIKIVAWFIWRCIHDYLLERGWSKFKIDTEYNHNQLKYRVDKLEGKSNG